MAYPPIIYNARRTGMQFQNVFGELGPERFVTGHYTAGPVDTSDKHAIELTVRYHGDHARKGWGGLGYHIVFTRKGNIILGRPLYMKGAHTGGHNSFNPGVMMHGSTNDRPSRKQRRAYRWWLANAHTKKMPASHRTDLDMRGATRLGHNSWTGHTSNGCPGRFKRMYLRGG